MKVEKLRCLHGNIHKKKSVDGDVAFDIMGFYMMQITYMLREIELMTLVGVIYIGYIDDMNFSCILFFIRI